MELPDIHFNKSEYIETASGNRNGSNYYLKKGSLKFVDYYFKDKK